MSELQYFEVVGDHAEFRPSGQVSLDQMAQLVASAIVFARKQHVRKLLAVTSGLTGFRSPNTFDRYRFVHKWAKASEYVVLVALVALPEMIDPQKFGVVVARNMGFMADIFASEAEALAWLQRSE
jgi:hypothetical protein